MGIHAEDAAERPYPRSCARCSPGALPPPPGPGRRSSSKEALREPTASCEAAKLEARRARDSLLRAATDTHEGTVNPAKADRRNAYDRAEAHVEKVRIEAFAARDDAIAAAYPVHDAAEEAAERCRPIRPARGLPDDDDCLRCRGSRPCIRTGEGV